MADQTGQKKKIPLNSFLSDFRTTMSDRDLRAKYGLSARAFVALIKELLARDLVGTEDLARRKQMGVQRDLAKETEFLSGLYICPQCSHPHPKPFQTCPACGAHAPEGNVDRAVGGPAITPSAGHFYLDENEPFAEFEAVPDLPPTEPMIRIEDPQKASTGDTNAGEGKRKKKKPAGEKPSALNSVRSFLSKLTKK